MALNKCGIQSSEFTDILFKMALKEVAENLIRDDREENLSESGAACFTCGRNQVRRSKGVASGVTRPFLGGKCPESFSKYPRSFSRCAGAAAFFVPHLTYADVMTLFFAFRLILGGKRT